MEDKNIDKNLNIEDMGEDNNHERDRKVAVNIVGEMRKSFLDYSMSVIVARALPDVRDGLKPVHRRILYTLYEEGMTPDRNIRNLLMLLVLLWVIIIHMVILLFMNLW